MVNKQMPILLENLRRTIPIGGTMKVNVYAVNDQERHIDTYDFRHGDTATITWTALKASGGTDLTHIGERTILGDSEPQRVVLAFTDGAHNSVRSLTDLKRKIAEAKRKGRFASTTFCRVTSSEKDTLFPELSAELAGNYFDARNMSQFFAQVNASTAAMTRAQMPLVVALAGATVALWQRDDTPGVYASGRTVNSGNTVTFGGNTQTVSPVPVQQRQHVDPAAAVDDDEDAKIAAQIAELEQRRKELAAAKAAQIAELEQRRKELAAAAA
jgi:hypothetical protein